LEFQWALRLSSSESRYGAALFALCFAIIKLNQHTYTRKPFNCGVPVSGAHSAELLRPSQGQLPADTISLKADGHSCFHTQPLLSELYVRFWFLLARSQVWLE